MTERPRSSLPVVPSAVVRLAMGALPTEALALLVGPVGETVARAACYAGRRYRRTAGGLTLPTGAPPASGAS